MITAFIPVLIGTLTGVAHAIDFLKYCAPMGVCGQEGEGLFIVIAERAAVMLLSVIGGACVLIIIAGGMRIIASAGSDTGRDEGIKMVTTAVIGLILSILAAALVQFVASFIGTNFV